ncbi:Eukaryotic/viral aspartic protease [Phytophthora megakarya]|uniref:Eukaryotic/viral aspartic protease n=1 Tax=Phytophthora megakarya TaxID=4795 RepID=A0A225UK16_9STRA|nr:Eukaryotic/viral aspartic protease [Phytophthora megakarya]
MEVSIIRLTIVSADANCANSLQRADQNPSDKVDKNDISPELQKIVFGRLPTETGLDLIGQPQSAERVIDADCIYAFISKCNYPDEDNDYCMNTTGFEKERGISLDGGELDLETEVKTTQDGDEYRWENVAETGSMVSVHAKMVKLLPGERMGANVSIISTTLTKRLQQIRGHGRQLEVQGIKKGKMSTSIRVAANITLGWNPVYEFDFWVMEHSAGSDVVLGTDFMILAGIRLDLFHATAKLPDEVMIPLVKAQNFDNNIPEGMYVPGGPNDNLQIAAGE